MFTKEERSSFAYWFAHWCAYQMTALNLKAWKFKYLFHDIEKPWLKLIFGGNYKKVQELHRKFNRHHTAYRGGVRKLDYQAMVIDWECSRFTKLSSPKTAFEMIDNEIAGVVKQGKKEADVAYFRHFLIKALGELNLIPEDSEIYTEWQTMWGTKL